MSVNTHSNIITTAPPLRILEANEEDISELTTDEIMNKLINFMKISQMQKYGMPIFETMFIRYLPYLAEHEISTLARSYWCYSGHIKVFIKHRGFTAHRNAPLKFQIDMSLIEETLMSKTNDFESASKLSVLLEQMKEDHDPLYENIENILLEKSRGHFVSLENIIITMCYRKHLTQKIANLLLQHLSEVFSKTYIGSKKINRLATLVYVLASHGAIAHKMWIQKNDFIHDTYLYGKKDYNFSNKTVSAKNQILFGSDNGFCKNIWHTIDSYRTSMICQFENQKMI